MIKVEESQPAEMEATLTPVVNKLDSSVLLLEEKLCREYNLTLEELRASTITIKNGEVTVKTKGSK